MNALIRPLLLCFCLATFAHASDQAQRAMWVYKTGPILASEPEQTALFEFCKARQITDLFWQTHFDRSDGVKLNDADATHGFLKAAHAQGLRIHTLGGDPAHALRRNHGRVLAMADAIIAFNREGEPFDGMHLDIEPHALPQWKEGTKAERCDLLAQLVEVHAQMAERLHAAAPALLYGADIVWWLDRRGPDGAVVYPVTFRGETADAARFLLESVDNVGIMGYRDKAEGQNGMIGITARTLEAADAARGRAFIGVKMADIGARREGFFGRTEPEMMQELQKVEDACRPHRGYAGLAFFHYEAFKAMAAGAP